MAKPLGKGGDKGDKGDKDKEVQLKGFKVAPYLGNGYADKKDGEKEKIFVAALTKAMTKELENSIKQELSKYTAVVHKIDYSVKNLGTLEEMIWNMVATSKLPKYKK